ncbi:nucleoside/nucleotide kinase family protein [Frondihabitans sucicola]|uniref:Nucleoside/nucleotide kinase family protein n=1 Tax=Frondihabitans sucicola TaxID=1268041 RepID=A0ABN6Y7D7_9MICO|nr:nucleoside/nucleotide kinase family protein [Frondihabitans sucicola]BDZ51916.1 nucleoside/nucleotide kinase family protein [Frondihabitans sucicola]
MSTLSSVLALSAFRNPPELIEPSQNRAARQTCHVQIDDLVQRVRAIQKKRAGSRVLLGIAGEPGGGKSTVAAALAAALGDAVVVPMDGFHLAGAELVRLGRADRKGAIDTFDAHGYLALLERLRAPVAGEGVYAPAYLREVEESIGSSILVDPAIPVVISEGNYLLVDRDPWPRVRAAFDEVWFVDTPRDLRLEWLVARHIAFGKPPEQATAWANGPDERNASLVRTTRDRADLVVDASALWPARAGDSGPESR